MRYVTFIKPIFDFTLAFFLLLILSWLILLVALGVRIFLGTPIFFKQPRPGHHSKIFMFYKFRTMTDHRDHHGHLLADDLRLSRFGKFLRASSLDELPQLFNILKGDMSFVGPRPLLVDYLPLYKLEERRRHLVKPGITGWAQVNGRNALAWPAKFALDCWYVDHQSFAVDLKIIWLTLSKVIKMKNVNQPGQATMERFTGSN